jgi:hypothetical protein
MCLAHQKESRISLLFVQNNATFQKEGGNPLHSKATKYIRFGGSGNFSGLKQL